jgi:hypothetical protein
MNLHRFVCASSLIIVIIIMMMICPPMGTGQMAGTEYEPKSVLPGKDVGWLPTEDALVEVMLAMANVTPEDCVVDLGSGDGRTVIAAAKRGARAFGVEYNPDLVAFSMRNAAKEGVSDKTEFIQADLFDVDFSRATVVTLFLRSDLNLKLRPKILNMKPGVEGTWKFAQAELRLRQSFQMVSGTRRSGDTRVPVIGRLQGDEISFTAGTDRYTGRVNGDTMEGQVVSGGNTVTWSATRIGGQ